MLERKVSDSGIIMLEVNRLNISINEFITKALEFKDKISQIFLKIDSSENAHLNRIDIGEFDTLNDKLKFSLEENLKQLEFIYNKLSQEPNVISDPIQQKEIEFEYFDINGPIINPIKDDIVNLSNDLTIKKQYLCKKTQRKLIEPEVINIKDTNDSLISNSISSNIIRIPKQGIPFISNRPKDLIYNSDLKVYCGLCKCNSKNLDNQNKLGPIYGPFKYKGILYYVHEYCALFSPEIFLNSSGYLINVVYQIILSKNISCNFCKRNGASIRCKNKLCKLNYHFLCAKTDHCVLDNQLYTMNCSDHCENRIYSDDLNSDIVCFKCKSGLDEEVLLICSKCEISVHTYCHIPKVNSIPKEDWFCYKCEKRK